MHQTRLHFPSVVWKTYLSSREALEIKIDQLGGEDLQYFSIRYIDGHNKGIIVQSVLAMVIYIVTRPNWPLPLSCKFQQSKGITPEEIAADPEFQQLLASLKYIRVNYQPMPAHVALYETLSRPVFVTVC